MALSFLLPLEIWPVYMTYDVICESEIIANKDITCQFQLWMSLAMFYLYVSPFHVFPCRKIFLSCKLCKSHLYITLLFYSFVINDAIVLYTIVILFHYLFNNTVEPSCLYMWIHQDECTCRALTLSPIGGILPFLKAYEQCLVTIVKSIKIFFPCKESCSTKWLN